MAQPVATMLVCFLNSHARLWVRASSPTFPAPSALRDEDFARLGRVSAAGMHGRVFSPEALCEGLSVEIILCHSGARVERASPESIVPRAREEKWIPGSRLRRAPE